MPSILAVNMPRQWLKDNPQMANHPLPPQNKALGTGKVADTWNRTGGLVGTLSKSTSIPAAHALAVWMVESGGRVHVPGQLLVRFENHILWKRWGSQNVSVFDAHFRFGGRPPATGPDCGKSFQCHSYRVDANSPWVAMHTPGADSQSRERGAIRVATTLAGEEMAYLCSSMGLAQIMGFNHAGVGYGSAVEMKKAFDADEKWQILAFFDFVMADAAMASALRSGEWEDFAAKYNGPGQKLTYGQMLSKATASAASVIPAPAE